MNITFFSHHNSLSDQLFKCFKTLGFSAHFSEKVDEVIYDFAVVTPETKGTVTAKLLLCLLPFTTNAQELKSVTSFRERYPKGILFYLGTATDKQVEDALISLLGFSPPREVYVGTPLVAAAHASPPPVPFVQKRRERPRFSRPTLKIKKTYLAVFAFMVITVLSLPFVTLAMALVTTGISVRAATSGSAVPVETLFKISGKAATVSTALFLPLTRLPVAQKQFIYFYNFSSLLKKSNSLAYSVMQTYHSLQSTLHSFISYEPVDWTALSNSLTNALTQVYKDASFLLADTQATVDTGAVGPVVALASQYVSKLPSLTTFAKELPFLVGTTRPVTYLFVFQNNMELRPTGGFIGSFALITFDQGRISSRTVHDIYDADGMITGFITPPEPIQKHLGEASWHMRDANWDPDFPTSARRLSWFLEKAMDQKVDGVVAVDLKVLQSLLSVTGPISLSEFGDTITTENMYETVQKRVEEDFFPGTSRKKTYLARVGEEVLMKLYSLPSDRYRTLFTTVDTLLQERNIQVWFPHESLQYTLSQLDWAGEVANSNCGEKCTGVVQVLNEANLGVNKANVAVSREVTANYERINNEVKGTVVLNLTHSGNYKNEGNESYKSYIRLLVPKGAVVGTVKIESEEVFRTVKADIKNRENYDEAGVLVTVLPSGQGRVTFQWSLPVESETVEIIWQKQAGVSPFPFTLTNGRGDVYNTTLRGTLKKPL